MSKRPAQSTVLVLRHHGLGDLITVQPALRAIRHFFPGYRLVVSCPSWLISLAKHLGTADQWIADTVTDVDPSSHRDVDASLLANVRRDVSSADVLISLRTPGPELLPIVEQLAPHLVVSYRYAALPATERFPELDFTDHILMRWRRLLSMVGIEPRDEDLYLRSAVPESRRDFTIVHIGAGSGARLWPVERWAMVTRYLMSTGHRVLLTGTAAEAERVSKLRTLAGLPPECDRAGRADALELAELVAGARLVLCVDSGVSHVATAYRRPALTLFGPVPPAWWGPPPGNPQHRTLWTGRTGDTYAQEADEGLLEISAASVIDALEEMRKEGILEL
jgi:ADP-heptose:LPS heptosyltransferase